MKFKNKRINQLVSKMAQSCISLDGEILAKKAMDFVNDLSRLPKHSSVPSIQLFQKLLKNMIDNHTLTIETDYDLTPIQIKTIEKSLDLVKISQVKVIKNESLLGGLRIRVGDKIYDDSVSGKILQLGVALRS